MADGLEEAPSSREIIALEREFGAANYAPLPVVVSRGRGCWVWDVEGQKYFDCISAYSSLNHGHCHPRIVAALIAQAERLTLTSRAVHNDQMAPFLRALCELAGFEMAIPSNTGVEAVETAIKLARKWGYRTKGIAADRAEIIVCSNNFHGRTTTVVGFSSEPQYREDFGPYAPGFIQIDFDNAAQLRRAINKNTAAFLVEPIQAEAGINVPSPGYLHEARRICTESNVLFMLDEIQTGLGRTGELFAYEHEHDSTPDVLILGKALGGGVYPVSAVLSSREILGLFRPGDHGSTFGGNPLAAAVARAAIDVLSDERLSERARTFGHELSRRLHALESPYIREIRGPGLLIGIEIDASFGTARDFARRLIDVGVLSKDTHQQVLRLAPPLTMTEAELDWLSERLARVFQGT